MKQNFCKTLCVKFQKSSTTFPSKFSKNPPTTYALYCLVVFAVLGKPSKAKPVNLHRKHLPREELTERTRCTSGLYLPVLSIFRKVVTSLKKFIAFCSLKQMNQPVNLYVPLYTNYRNHRYHVLPHLEKLTIESTSKSCRFHPIENRWKVRFEPTFHTYLSNNCHLLVDVDC